MLTAWARKRGRGAWSGRQHHADGTARNGQHQQGAADPAREDGREAGPGDDGEAELEAALRIARYWQAHPERLAEALRWPHGNGRA